MSHYFIDDDTIKHDPRQFAYCFKNHEFTFITDSGVFSKSHIDKATEILLKAIPPLSGSLLDMGCGYGCIGIILAKVYSLRLTQADINRTAVELTKQNCRNNNVNSDVVLSNCFDNINGLFDTITLNPPIHAGKAVTYKMYEDAAGFLNQNGRMYVVTLKKHGAESTEKKLTGVFGNCETLYKMKGIYVFRCG
jgi:16S rRNA (guanine1207-N2)-methyltransferase